MLVCVGYTYGLGTAGVPNIGRLTGRKKQREKNLKMLEIHYSYHDLNMSYALNQERSGLDGVI